MRKRASTTEWITVSELTFDRAVNTRPPKPQKVKGIADAYNPEALGFIEVSRREDGTLVVLDGQHRVHALLLLGLGDKQVECKIHKGLTTQEEAALFLSLNNETPVSAIHKMMGEIEAGVEPAASIDKIVHNVGLRIGDQKAAGTICAPNALRRIYAGARFQSNQTGEHPELLQLTLRVAQRAWGKQPDALAGNVLTGLGTFFARYKDSIEELDSFISKLASHPGGPYGLLGEARGLKALHDSDLAGAFAARCVDVYNRGRRKSKLTNWWAS